MRDAGTPRRCSPRSAARVVYRVLRARAVTDDLARIHDHLVESYCDLGDGIADALDRASGRVQTIEDAMTRLGAGPHQGTLCEDVMPRLRRATKDKAILYFITDDDFAEVRVLSVFFSGQDHLRHIVERLGTRRASRPDEEPDDLRGALETAQAPTLPDRAAVPSRVLRPRLAQDMCAASR